MTPEELLLPSLVRQRFPSCVCRVYPVAGACVLEVITAAITPPVVGQFAAWIYGEMARYNETLPLDRRHAEGIGIHRLFAYAQDGERYSVRGILRTQPSGYRDGIWNSTLTAADAFVLLAEPEIEVLLLGGSLNRLLAIENNSFARLRPRTDGLYLGLDVAGLSLSVRSVGRGPGPNEWTIDISLKPS